MKAIEDRLRHKLFWLSKISAHDAFAIWPAGVISIFKILGGVSRNQANKSVVDFLTSNDISSDPGIAKIKTSESFQLQRISIHDRRLLVE